MKLFQIYHQRLAKLPNLNLTINFLLGLLKYDMLLNAVINQLHANIGKMLSYKRISHFQAWSGKLPKMSNFQFNILDIQDYNNYIVYVLIQILLIEYIGINISK